jgi:hypothetical protein
MLSYRGSRQTKDMPWRDVASLLDVRLPFLLISALFVSQLFNEFGFGFLA